MKHLLVINNIVDTVYKNTTAEKVGRPVLSVPDDTEVFAGYEVSGDEGSGWVFTAPAQIAENYHLVPRYTIIKRLEAAGKFTEALAALKSDDLLYEKWQSIPEIRSDDSQARALFASIGVEPDTILAR